MAFKKLISIISICAFHDRSTFFQHESNVIKFYNVLHVCIVYREINKWQSLPFKEKTYILFV